MSRNNFRLSGFEMSAQPNKCFESLNRQIEKDKSRAYKQAFETSNSAQIALFKNFK